MWNPYNNPHDAQYATVTVYYPTSCVNNTTTTTTTTIAPVFPCGI